MGVIQKSLCNFPTQNCEKESAGGLRQATLTSQVRKEKSEKAEQLRRVMNIIHLMVKRNHAEEFTDRKGGKRLREVKHAEPVDELPADA